mmetsp:Transcript_42573/g.47382  ORF Transcript_42573/g.47382 Transcript_42573/m.47382 type:complete len:132 (+) Transcript_42573:679-1074(+)
MVLSQKEEEEVNSWNRIEFELNCINSLKSSLSFRLDTTLTQSSLPVSVSLSLHIIYLVHHTIQFFLCLDIDRRMMLVAYIIMHPYIMFFFSLSYGCSCFMIVHNRSKYRYVTPDVMPRWNLLLEWNRATTP